MCCFTTPVNYVANTRIFARLADRNRQFLVYQMDYKAEKPVAMILPLPVALPTRDDAVAFLNLKEYPEFFRDLASGIPLQVPTRGGSLHRPAPGSKAALVVHEVGDFVASFVPNVDDFARLDRRFSIPKSTWAKIPIYADYGFAVFQLKSLAGTPHPMAFSFPTRMPGRLFFPTVHIHDGAVHEREEFDHALYFQSGNGFFAQDMGASREISTQNAADFVDIKRTRGIVDGGELVRRLPLHGMLNNGDVIMGAGNGPGIPYPTPLRRG